MMGKDEHVTKACNKILIVYLVKVSVMSNSLQLHEILSAEYWSG